MLLFSSLLILAVTMVGELCLLLSQACYFVLISDLRFLVSLSCLLSRPVLATSCLVIAFPCAQPVDLLPVSGSLPLLIYQSAHPQPLALYSFSPGI